MNHFWDKKYASDEYVYGTSPNVFLKQSIEKYLTTGKLLFPGEGEGRNAVYAAQMGFEVVACDQSIEGKIKAEKLAAQAGVQIKYHVGNLFDIDCKDDSFDAVFLIYTHFPSDMRKAIHDKMTELLKPGGLVVMEVFSKNHTRHQQVNPSAGGPRDIDMLYTKEHILSDFDDFIPLEIEEVETRLAEGAGHDGLATVIRFVGRKK